MKRRSTKTYPTIDVGDKVIILKKNKMDKGRVSNWSDTKFEVSAIEEDRGHTFYTLAGISKLLMRHELLL
eukprot:7948942-Heterocapsa_arctica.AAC.1